ncbi:eukaryotic translation initiation factor 5A-2 [Xylaria sp. FL1777]|nr:eukaryotic translation initiation factor 5A-2 [Xylaria sp. FL1777]
MAEEEHNYDFGSASADASLTTPTQCSALRKGGLVVIKGRPCKIIEMSTSKTGKHGHAKVHLVATDIFTGKKLEDLCPSTHNMDVPGHRKESWNLQYLTRDGYLNLMSDEGEENEKIRVPEGEVGEQIRALLDDEGLPLDDSRDIVITLIYSMGEVHATKVDIK